MVPPPRIHLERCDSASAHAHDQKAPARDLEACGFRRLGAWCIEPIKGMMATAFAHGEQSLCAVVYTHSLAGSWVDIVAKSEAGRSLTVSSRRWARNSTGVPGMRRFTTAA
jgi:hypothetical protein